MANLNIHVSLYSVCTMSAFDVSWTQITLLCAICFFVQYVCNVAKSIFCVCALCGKVFCTDMCTVCCFAVD